MIVIWPPQTKTKPEELSWLPELANGSQKRRTLLRLAEEKLISQFRHLHMLRETA